jgi:hypothetical protein
MLLRFEDFDAREIPPESLRRENLCEDRRLFPTWSSRTHSSGWFTPDPCSAPPAIAAMTPLRRRGDLMVIQPVQAEKGAG